MFDPNTVTLFFNVLRYSRGVDSYQQSSSTSSSSSSVIGSAGGGTSSGGGGGTSSGTSTSYFDQTPSGASSASATPETFNPFGILPHENLVPSSLNNGSSPSTTSTSLTKSNYGNFNSQFSSNVIVGSNSSTTAAQLLQQQQQQQQTRSR